MKEEPATQALGICVQLKGIVGSLGAVRTGVFALRSPQPSHLRIVTGKIACRTIGMLESQCHRIHGIGNGNLNVCIRFAIFRNYPTSGLNLFYRAHVTT